MADLVTLKAVVYGRVQGVFFRAFVSQKANELGLKGYVRNMQGGSVEVLAEGEKDKLEKLVGYLKAGPSHARVEKVVSDWTEITGNHTVFEIRY